MPFFVYISWFSLLSEIEDDQQQQLEQQLEQQVQPRQQQEQQEQRQKQQQQKQQQKQKQKRLATPIVISDDEDDEEPKRLKTNIDVTVRSDPNVTVVANFKAIFRSK